MRISESLNFEVADFGDLRVIWGFGFLVWGKTQNVKAPRCFRRSGSSDTHSKPRREEYLERVSRASAEAAGVYQHSGVSPVGVPGAAEDLAPGSNTQRVARTTPRTAIQDFLRGKMQYMVQAAPPTSAGAHGRGSSRRGCLAQESLRCYDMSV